MKQHCREVLERAYLFLDGEMLSEQERIEIELHLEECGPCLERYGLDKEAVFVLNRFHGKTPCPDSLRNRISSLLDQA